MATLEIHHGRGDVAFLNVERDQMVTIGADPKCDIVVRGSGVAPIHARLRWSRDRIKVEAIEPDRPVEINGRAMKSGSLRQGGELAVGTTRVFLITPLDEPPPDPRSAKPASSAPTNPAPPPAARPRPKVPEGEFAPPSFEAVRDLFDEPATPAAIPSARPEKPLRRARPKHDPPVVTEAAALAPAGAASDSRSPSATSAKGPTSRFAWVRRLIVSEEDDAGQRLITSPFVIGLVVTLLVLVGLAFQLTRIIGRLSAQRMFDQAQESFEAGEFRNAVKQFEQFVESHPDDARAGQARVRGALSDVRQFTRGGAPAWSNGLEAAESMVGKVGELPEFGDARVELAADVVSVAAGLADRAAASGDPDLMRQAERATRLHETLAGEPGAGARLRARVPEKLAAARVAVLRVAARGEAIAAMDRALAAREPGRVYEERDALIARYPELATDARVAERIGKANTQVKAAVVVTAERRNATREPRTERLGPPVSFAMRSSNEAAKAGAPVVAAVAEGMVYAFDGNNGAVLWHQPVGLDVSFPPLVVPGEPASVIAFDGRHNELVRFDAFSGSLLWRLELGGPARSAPRVMGNQVYLAMPSGDLLVIDLESGDELARAKLGRPLGPTPEVDEQGKVLLVFAEASIVFLITRDPLECVAVCDVGHGPGTLGAAPLRVGRWVVVPENHRPDIGRWRIGRLDESVRDLKVVQVVDRPGWTWDTPPTRGPVVWSVTDRGGADAFAFGPANSAEPLRRVAQLATESASLGPTFGLAAGENELWVASGRSGRLDLDAEAGTIASRWSVGQAGPALGPIQRLGERAVFTQQAPASGGTALWCVDTDSGEVVWRTFVGVPWPQPPRFDGSQGLTTSDPAGGALAIDAQIMERGGVIERAFPPSADQPNARPIPMVDPIRLGDLEVVVPSLPAGSILVRSPDQPEPRRVDLPVDLVIPPVAWGADLLVAGEGGLVYLVDPSTGIPRGEPLLTGFDREAPTHWVAAQRLDERSVVLLDTAGRLRRLTKTDGERPRLEVASQAALESPPIGPPALAARGLVVVTEDRQIRSLATRDFSPVGTWPLEAPLAIAPQAVAEGILLADEAGTIQRFDADGRRAWTASLPGPPAGPPALLGDQLWFLTRAGNLSSVALGDGTVASQGDVGTLPAGGPIAVAESLWIPVAPGTLRRWNSTTEGAKP